MSSESQVKNIMECIDEGLKELDELEEKLERYDRLLQVQHDLATVCRLPKLKDHQTSLFI